MRILGVTGGIGSGKSTVCALLAARGAHVFYADSVAKELQVSDPGVRKAIREAFGEEAYGADGSLNRSYLAGRVFSSEADRRTINRIVHPAVAQAFETAVSRARREGARLFVKEAALLFNTDTSLLDEILVVDAPDEVRLRRVADRDGISVEAVKARMDTQLSREEMLRRADRVIANDGTLEDLRIWVERLYDEITGTQTAD